MTDGTINKYFTPLQKSAKRQRSYSSPTSPEDISSMGPNIMGGDEEKVGDLTNGQLRSALRDVMSDLLDSKLSTLATKSDLVNLSQQISDLQTENTEQKVEIKELKRQNRYISDKLLDLECRSRRNNLIFRGLQWNEKTKDFKEVVGKFCNDMLGMNNQMCINRAHPLGRERNAIIAHFPYDSDIDFIMNRVKALRNTGYAVFRDFPREVRIKRKCLAAVRAEVERVAGRRRMPIVHDHLTIDGCRFTWEDGRLLAGRQNGADKLRTMFRHEFSDFLSGLRERQEKGDEVLIIKGATDNKGMVHTGASTASSDGDGVEASGGGADKSNGMSHLSKGGPGQQVSATSFSSAVKA